MGGIRQRVNKAERHKFKIINYTKMAEQFLAIKTTFGLTSLLEIPEHAFIALLTNQYQQFTIPKKNGKKRLITKPSIHILQVQRKLNLFLQSVYLKNIPVNIFGNIPYFIDSENRDALKNAEVHHGSEYILNLDIKDFFQSIDISKVKIIFTSPPFNFSDELTELICKLVTYQEKLPVGAATSSIISNFVFSDLDSLLHDLANQYNACYSRYIDDLTFSFNQKPSSDFIKKAVIYLERDGYLIAWEKFQLRGKNQRQEVTGIIVNEYPNVRAKYYKELRAVLYNLENKNVAEEVDKYFKANLFAYKRSIKTYWNNYFNNDGLNVEISDQAFEHLYRSRGAKYWYTLKSVRGKLSYLGHILGKDNERYVKLLKQYKWIEAYLKSNNEPITPEPSLELVYITNATSRSVVYYAYSFLLYAGFNDKKIKELRESLQLDKTLCKDKLHNSFINQSTYFLNLYHYILELNNAGYISDNLYKIKEWNKLQDGRSIIYKRGIFHIGSGCGSLKSDYNEEVQHKNTGVFGQELLEESKSYLVEKNYLTHLGMRGCKICYRGC